MALSSPPAAPPLVAGDRVFVSTLPGLVTAYQLQDGRELWRETLNPEQPIEAHGDLVIVAAGEAVHALRAADRTVAWRTPTGKLTAPLLAKDGWIIAASAEKIFALRASDGAIIWSRDSSPQRRRPAISGDLMFVPLATGALRAVDLLTGAPRWERRIAGAPAEPLVLGDRVYVGGTDKNFYCMKTDDGEIDWTIRAGAAIRGKASTDGERVFFAALDNLVRAVTRASGAQRWQQGVPFRPFEGPAVIGSTVMIAGPVAEVRLLNVLDGRDAGKVTFPEALAVAPAVTAASEGVVVAGITGGLAEAWKLWLAAPAAKDAKGVPTATSRR